MDGLVQQVLTGLDTTLPVKPEPVSDVDASTKLLDDIFNSISNPPPEDPTKNETSLDKLITELKMLSEPQTGENQKPPENPFGPQEDWGEERY